MANKVKDVSFEKLSVINRVHKKDTESAFKDRIYNWIIDRYTKNGRLFEFSDRFVWSGAVYALPEIFGYLLFFAIFYWIGYSIEKHYGWERMVMFFFLLVIWRVNMLVKYLSKINKKLGDKNEKI